MKSHCITAKFGKFLDYLIHGKWHKCRYYKTCEDARAERGMKTSGAIPAVGYAGGI
jgi:hypothetical protein